METRFILPVTCATALHVLVLFGIKIPSGSKPTPPPIPPHAAPFHVVMYEEPEPPLEPEAGAAPKKGEPESFLPQLDEVPPTTSTYEQPFTPINPHPDVVADRLPMGPVGVINGIPDGKPGPGVIGVEFLDNPPRTRSQVPPSYPIEARSQGLTGEVSVEFIVDEGGHVQQPRVVHSSDARFDAATLRAVAKWRFEPGKKNNRPVRFRMVAPVVFSLET